MREKRNIAIAVVWFTLLTLWIAQAGMAQSVTYKAQGKFYRLTPVPNLYVTGLVNSQPGTSISPLFNEIIPNVVKTSSLGGGMTLVQTNQSIPFTYFRAKKAARDGSNQSYLYPVYHSPGSKLQVYPRPEIVVCVRKEADIQEIAQQHHLTVIRPLLFTNDQFVLGLDASSNPFSVSDSLWNDPGIVWSNPNCARQIEKCFTPNDPLYPDQWHLNNTGQNGATEGADISAEAAWDLQKPSEDIVIAIVDDEVELDHPDLNIYTNAIEAEGTEGVDDDNNGLIDDIHGWDFGNNDNDPNPQTANQRHGTACAGTAAAIGNNGEGVVGASYGSPILPVKMSYNSEENSDQTSIADDVKIAEAVRYAAKYADIMSNSWSNEATLDVISSAFDFAASSQSKRGEKGVPVLISSGNKATWFQTFESSNILPPGTYKIVMSYTKDASDSSGDDCVLIEDAWLEKTDSYAKIASIFPTDENFPEGVSSDGDAQFTIEATDITKTGYVYKSGAIGDDQWSDLIWEIELTEEAFFFLTFRISSEEGVDGFTISLNDELMPGGIKVADGVPWIEQPYTGEAPYNIKPIIGVGVHPKVINIGASNDRDVRSLYSQWGPELKFVAPSDGGINAITTTDLSAEGWGYDPNFAYTSIIFGGTSAACPLAAGCFALVMAVNPDFTVDEIVELFKQTADKIGDVEYDENGFNEQYGYGRINLGAAVELAIQSSGQSVSGWDLY